jgi:serine phosphatase RsbU (regulator of sigma subunit)
VHWTLEPHFPVSTAAPIDDTALPTAHDRAKVLLVEDDAGDAFLVRELLLEDAPEISVVTVSTLAEAERQIDAVDCVLLDLGLPDTQGLDGLVRLRRVAPDAAVLVLTGLDDVDRGVAAVASGAHDYLVKGRVDGSMLAKSIRYAIARRRAERSERALLEAELQTAENARLERGLLPKALLRDPALELVAGYRPGRRRAVLGGDFYDAVELDDGTLHLAIGDVCGHGADEAALGVLLRMAWRTLILAQRPADEILATLERVLVAERHRPDIFTTFALVSVSADRTSAQVWLAGHPAPVLLDPAGAPSELAIDRVHLPLGLIGQQEWQAQTVALPPRWTLLLFTDGLIEGRVGDGSERLGVAGLAAALDELRGSAESLQELLDGVLAHVEGLNGGRHADDVAALLISSRPR